MKVRKDKPLVALFERIASLVGKIFVVEYPHNEAEPIFLLNHSGSVVGLQVFSLELSAICVYSEAFKAKGVWLHFLKP